MIRKLFDDIFIILIVKHRLVRRFFVRITFIKHIIKAIIYNLIKNTPEILLLMEMLFLTLAYITINAVKPNNPVNNLVIFMVTANISAFITLITNTYFKDHRIIDDWDLIFDEVSKYFI